MLDDDETEVPDVRDCELPPLTVYVTTKLVVTLELKLFKSSFVSKFK